MDKEKILIVDDDENIAELISLYLNKECYETQIATDGASALEAFVEFMPNLILLDVMLPGMDGYQVCTEIRKQSNVPIIMLSAKGEVFDKVLGLKIGADDYIVKPFDSNELVARVGALLRRCNSRTDNSQNYNPPPKELELLYFLASRPNQVFTREQLLDKLWGYEYVGDTRTVDVHIKRLREKLTDKYNWSIFTVWGIGYKFEVK